MTEFTVSPIWYPAYALPMLLLTITSAILLPSFISYWDSWKKSQQWSWHFSSNSELNSQGGLGIRSSNSSAVTRSLPLSMVVPNISRGRELKKSSSEASIKHHIRRNSLPGSLRSRRDSREGSPVGREKEKGRRLSPIRALEDPRIYAA
jgi:hypothetical protein